LSMFVQRKSQIGVFSERLQTEPPAVNPSLRMALIAPGTTVMQFQRL
jgi:hypothetical protein